MVESIKQKASVEVKHFKISENESFAQFSWIGNEDQYSEILTGEAGKVNLTDVHEPGKNKLLILALDVSGSMAGAPINALKLGAKEIGERYFAEEKPPYERMTVLLYNNRIEQFEAQRKDQFLGKCSQIRAGGGTNMMNVFLKIDEIV